MAARVSVTALQLAFRVSVTGTRMIPAAMEATVRKAVAEILGAIRATVERLAAMPGMHEIYAAPSGRVVPHLRVVSPLAEGADRLVAEEALKRGYALDAILPFEQSEYERDFPESLDRFRTLLAHAGGRVLALDGGRGVAEWRSYEAVGRHVVRNCDLVIAIWDPDVPPKGRGGTEDTILFAVETGLPVWWIDASGRRPAALVETSEHFRDLMGAPRNEDARARLDAGIEHRLVPPTPERGVERGLLDRLVATMRRFARLEPDPLRAFLTERERRRADWRLFDRVMHVAARGSPFRWPDAQLPVPAVSQSDDGYWSGISNRTRRLSIRCADRHRNAGLFMIGFLALGAAAGAIGLALQVSDIGRDGFVLVVAALSVALVCGLATADRLGRWKERWEGYRALADLARAQQALGWIGWNLTQADTEQVRLFDVAEVGSNRLRRQGDRVASAHHRTRRS